MTAPDKGAQGALDLGAADLYGKPRRVEQATQAAVESARLDDRDKAAAALAVELGRAVDVAATRKDPYGVATAARELREPLTRLRLDPASRESSGTHGDLSWLDALGPTVPEPPRPGGAPVRDSPDA